MQQHLLQFIVALRRRGVDVSPGEHLDALAALQCVPWDDRTAFREALRATLIKRPEHISVFDEEFALAFSAPPLPNVDRKGKTGAGGRKETRRESERRRGEGAEHRRRDGQRREERLTDERLAEKRGTKRSVQSEPGPPRKDAEQSKTAGQRVTFRGAQPPRAERSIQELTRADLKCLSTAEVQELRRHVRIMARRLASRRSRRRRASRRGQVDVKRTLRRSLQYGGVPFRLAHRQRRIARAEIVVLCDVSGSVKRVAELLLELLDALAHGNSVLRVFAYTNRVAEVTAGVRKGPADLADLAAAAGVDLHAFSDFGHVCYDMTHRFPGIVGRKTTLLVIGDARNNYGDPMTWAFEELARHARRVVWLVPEPRERWNTADSQIAAYAPLCHVVAEAHTLQRLVRALGKV